MGLDITKSIEKILWGKSFAEVKDSQDSEHVFILRSLNIKESNFCNYIYDREYKTSLDLGVLTNDELVQMYIDSDVWSEDGDKRIEVIENGLKFLQSQLKDAQFFTAKKKKLQKEIDKYRREADSLKEIKANLFTHSAESRAEEVMRRYMVMLSTETIDEQKYWETEIDFLNERDAELLVNLALAYYKSNMFFEKDLRSIARAGQWRFRWLASKNGADLFGRPISEWSEMQNALVYWSEYYDQIYDSSERPSDQIINNDEACDAWVREQSKKSGHGINSGKQDKNFFGNKKAKTNKDHQEQFIMVKPGDKEAIHEVQDMNTDSVRRRLGKENEKIKQTKGRVKEWQLRKGNK